MSARVEKLRNERAKNEEKILKLQERNHEIDDSVLQLENEEIITTVREEGISPDQLADLLKALRERGPAVVMEGFHEAE